MDLTVRTASSVFETGAPAPGDTAGIADPEAMQSSDVAAGAMFDRAAIDTAEAGPTVLQVPPTDSFTSAKRNDLRNARIRPTGTNGHPLPGRSAHPDQGAGDSQGVARARSGSPDTVPCMPSTDAADMSAMQIRMARLGRILDDVDVDGFGDEPSDSEIFFGRGRHEPLPSLAVGPVTRKLDEDGRFKVILDAGALCDLLAWGAGSLEVTAAGGWLLLRQPGDLVGVKPPKSGNCAGITRDAKGLDRIGLKPAHIYQLHLGPDDLVLVVPLVDIGAVALVNPSVPAMQCLPPFISQILADASCAA